MGSDPGASMTNDPPADDPGVADSEAFEEWLDQAAESKGVSRQELMNQMLSSYWILDELTGLVGEAEFDGGTDHRSPGPSEAAHDAEATPEAGAEADSSAEDSDVTDPSDGDSSVERPSTEESIREIHAAIQGLMEAQSSAASEQSPGRSSGSVSPFDEGVVSVVSELQRQIGKFESKLEDVENRQDTQFNRLSDELQLLLDRVHDLEHGRDGERYADADEFDTLVAKVSELEDRIEGLRSRDEELRSRDAELESRMDREFDSIEELFHRLFSALDDLDAELETTTESYREELEPIQQRESDRKRLEELKTEAMRRDVRRGRCESCDRGVDLTLLESPDCPHCEVRFTGIDEGGWNPFRSPTLETETGLGDRA